MPFGWINDPTQMDPMTNLGLSLLANSNTPGNFGSIFGRSALQAQQGAQNAQMNQLQIQQQQAQLQALQQRQAFMQQLMGGMPPSQGSPQPSQSGLMSADTDQTQAANTTDQFRPGISPMPQGQQQFGWTPQSQSTQPSQDQTSSQTQGGLPSWLTPLSPDQISAIPVNGIPGQLASRAAMVLQNKDAATAQKETLAQQYETAQRVLSPKLQTLDYLIKSDKPTQYMQADKQLMAAWPQLAQKAGIEPSEYTDDNVRRALAFARNQVATSIGLPASAPPNRLVTKGIQQIDPVTGKVEKELETGNYVTPQGVRTVAKEEAIEKGYTPYNQAQFIAGNITGDAKEQAYQRWLQTGEMPAVGKGGAAAAAEYANYIAQRAKAEGRDLGGAAQNQAFKAQQGVIKDFTSGQTSKTLNGLNTAISHMDQLDQAASALQNGNIQGLNKLSNFFKTQFGADKVTNFNVVKNFAAGEVAKAVLPGGGGEREREEIADAIKNSSSPEQLHSAIQMWRNLLAGKTDALRNQWDVGTNGTQGSFDKFLLPATKKALGVEQPANTGNSDAELLKKWGG